MVDLVRGGAGTAGKRMGDERRKAGSDVLQAQHALSLIHAGRKAALLGRWPEHGRGGELTSALSDVSQPFPKTGVTAHRIVRKLKHPVLPSVLAGGGHVHKSGFMALLHAVEGLFSSPSLRAGDPAS